MRARESLLQYFLKTTGSKIESLTCTNTLIPFITKKKMEYFPKERKTKCMIERKSSSEHGTQRYLQLRSEAHSMAL